MIVMKFGGTSVGNPDRIKNVCDIVKTRLAKKPIVVVSAVGGITDMLIKAANTAVKGKVDIVDIRKKHMDIVDALKLDRSLLSELDEFEDFLKGIAQLKETSPRIMDKVQSFGERISSKIVAAYMTKVGMPAKAWNSYDAGLVTDSNFGKAEPLPEAYDALKILTRQKEVPIVTGFIGKDNDGAITTLGRGGSDYSGAIVGAAVDAEEIEIWTDVNGVMSADPRVVPEAKTIPSISFQEASELAYFGAKVLHPKTIRPAMEKDIPVRVLSTFEPNKKGTLIINKSKECKEIVKAIASKKNIVLFSIVSTRMLLAHGFLAKMFAVFEHYKKPVDMIATSEVSVSLTVDNDENVPQILEELEQIAKIKIEKDKAIVCCVGEGMENSVGVSGRIFSVVGKAGIRVHMISQGASEINISFIVDNKDADAAVKALHTEFVK